MPSIATTLLELAGIALLVGFAWFCWPPAALGVAGAAAVIVSWRVSTPRVDKP